MRALVASEEVIEAARIFNSMSAEDQSNEVAATAIRLIQLDARNVVLNAKKFGNLARSLLPIGRLEEYVNLEVDKRREIIERSNQDYPIEGIFLLNDLRSDIELKSFRGKPGDTFDHFNRAFVYDFHFVVKNNDYGSLELRRALHDYFNLFWAKGYCDANGIWRSDQSLIDDYMAYTVLVLKGLYGEESIIGLLEKMNSENFPLSACDFIKIMQSGLEYSDYPLSWAVEVS